MKPMECVLSYSAKGLVRQGSSWVIDKERAARLPATPPAFVPVRALYGEVSRHAVKLNELQKKTGFWDFIFHPEPASPEMAQ